jgi:cytochrome c-type biogenesis protein CcmH/NrfG
MIFRCSLFMQRLAVAVIFALSCSLVRAQQPQPPARQITGQIKLAGRPAPAGVPVALQIVLTGDPKTSGSVVARTTTDAQGRFTFDHLENVGNHHGQSFFEVSSIQAGYEGAVQVVDLTQTTQGTALLDLRPDFNLHSSKPASPGPAPAATHALTGNVQAQEAMAQGQELLFRRHDPEASLAYFKKAVNEDPWYGQGYMLLGLANMQLGRWDDAQYAFEEAAKVEPGNAKAFLGVGSALNQQQHYPDAEKALEHSLDLKPDSAEAHFELARTLAGMDKWQDAAPHVLRAIELDPNYAGPHAMMGNIYLREEDAASALAEFKKYLELDPQGSLAPQVKKAVTQLEQALKDAEQRR